MKPVCYFLVGAPYMGKSFYVENHTVLKHLPVVSSDRELLKLCDKAGLSYHEGFQQFFLQAKDAMTKHLKQILRSRQDFVYDRTNLTLGGRVRMIHRLKAHGYEVRCVNFGVPRSPEELAIVAERRVERRRQFIPEDVFQIMCGQYTMPSFAEGFDEIIQVPMQGLKEAGA